MTILNKTTNETFKWADVDEEYSHIIELKKQKVKVNFDKNTPKHVIQRRRNLELMESKDYYPSNSYYVSIIQNINQMLFPPTLTIVSYSKFK
jgi:hypothetical protein